MYKPTDHTFVVCAYGDSPYLEKCLKSLVCQSVKTNVIISTSTPSKYIGEVAKKYQCALYTRRGVSKIQDDWNYAISCAQTPLVTIAHQDDEYNALYVECMLKKLKEVQHPLIFFTGYGEIRSGQYINDSPLIRTKRRMLWIYSSATRSAKVFFKRLPLAFGNPICCPSVTYVKSALPNPIFNSLYKSNLDWDTWERLSKINGTFLYDDMIGVYHRVHGASETTACIADDTRNKEDFEMLKKFWPTFIAKILNRFYSKAQRYN